jgi:REP element-mobilizing transposase RayT
MRPLRILKQGVWYLIRTRINNREPLFRNPKVLALFARVFRETEKRFVFQWRGLLLEDDWLMVYIKPEDGFELPDIMQWLKQVFAQRYNGKEGRIGHLWGDRYWSGILEEGEPEVDEGDGGDEPALGVRPHGEENTGNPRFPLIYPQFLSPSPG